MARLTIQQVAAPDLSSTGRILASAGRTLNQGLESAGKLLATYQSGQQEFADNQVLSDIAGISSEEDLNSYINSGALEKVNLSPDMRNKVLGLRSNILSNQQTKANTIGTDARTIQTGANTGLTQANTVNSVASGQRTAAEYLDQVGTRNESRNLTGLVLDANAEGRALGDKPAANTNFLRYTNKGAIRSQPISNKLSGSMSFLSGMGVTMEVFSGGQDAKGSGGKRTGSTRHDGGEAADAKFFAQDGHQLDPSNPQDRIVLGNIVAQARANGVTGIGAGKGYMGSGSMHIGFGKAAVWGKGGKSSNAPDWLKTAYARGTDGSLSASAPQQTQPAAQALRDAVRGSDFISPSQGVALDQGIIASQGQGQARINSEANAVQRETSAGIAINAAQNIDNTNQADVANQVISTPGQSNTQTLANLAQANKLTGEGGVLSGTLSPNVAQTPASIAIQNSVESFNRSEAVKLESTVPHRVITRADTFNDDPTQDIIKLLGFESDGETPRNNWFAKDHDPNVLRTIINDVARKANVTPKVAGSALVEIFERDPWLNNSDANRFDQQSAVDFIQANMNQTAMARYEESKLVSAGKQRELSGLTLQLNTLKTSAAKSGGNVSPQLQNQIQSMENQILSFTNSSPQPTSQPQNNNSASDLLSQAGAQNEQDRLQETEYNQSVSREYIQDKGLMGQFSSTQPGTPERQQVIQILIQTIQNDQSLGVNEKRVLISTITG